MCPLALFWHLVKEKPLVKIALALQLNELWDTSVAEWPGAQAPCGPGWLLLCQGAGCFLEMFMQFSCAPAGARHFKLKKTKKTQQEQKNPNNKQTKTPSLRSLRPLVYLSQVSPSTKYCQISVLFGSAGWRELESCLHCCQWFLMMFLTRENELACMRIQIPCGAQFGKLKIWEGKEYLLGQCINIHKAE